MPFFMPIHRCFRKYIRVPKCLPNSSNREESYISKSCGRASVSEVRILSLPPEAKEESLLSCFVSEGSTEDNISSRFRQDKAD